MDTLRRAFTIFTVITTEDPALIPNFGGIHCTKFELILKAILMIRNTSVPRALRASVQSTELLQKQKCGKTLNENADSVLRNNFLGKGFAKPRLIFSAGILDFARAEEGSGEESARTSAFLFLASIKNSKYIILKSRRSRDTSFVLCLTHPPVRAQIPAVLGDIIKRRGLLPRIKPANLLFVPDIFVNLQFFLSPWSCACKEV